MSNMSYCQFENTLRDLSDCFDKLYEIQGDFSRLSETEACCAKQLIEMCQSLGEYFGDKK